MSLLLGMLLSLLASISMAQDQDKTGHYVTIGIASDNEPDKFYEISIQKELDPRVQAEEVCAFLELRDPSCALATKELVRKHQTLHGPSPFDTNPVPACELAQAYAAEMDASKSDRVCPVESWLRSARGWAARRNNPRHNGQLLLSEDEDKDKQHLCSGDDGPLLNTNSDVAQNPTEKAQDSAPTRVHCPQSVAAKASTGLDQGRGRPGTSSAAFDSKSPYDGRMGWMADANHPIFSYPTGTFGSTAGPSGSGGGACGEDGGEGGQPSSPSRPASFSSSAATTSMQPIGPLLAELADIALAPWSSGVKPEHRHDDRGDDDGKRVKEEFESSGDSDSGSGGGGDGTITQADVDAALTTDPKVCSRLTYLIAVGGVSGVSGGSGVRGGTGKGEWRISRPCNRNPSSTLSSASQDGAVNGNNLTAPFGLQEEPWWRVRRRQAALEVLLDATRMLQLNGTPLRHNTQIVLCVGDGVPVARPRYSHVPPSSSSSSSSSASSSSSSHPSYLDHASSTRNNGNQSAAAVVEDGDDVLAVYSDSDDNRNGGVKRRAATAPSGLQSSGGFSMEVLQMERMRTALGLGPGTSTPALLQAPPRTQERLTALTSQRAQLEQQIEEQRQHRLVPNTQSTAASTTGVHR